MQVEVRSHPRGEAGTRISIDEAAKRAGTGRLDPRVRAWAIEKIVQAGNPIGVLDRAKVLLDALRRERIYVEDPTDSDFMPSAACTLVGCEGLMFLGEDCDGLLIAWLAACGSVGIFGAVVGHSYDPKGQLSHVLGAVWDGTSKWYRADPSTKQEFGVVAKPTRERWVSVHDGRVLCDKDNGCDANKLDAPMSKMRSSSEFVGVVGRPQQGSGLIGDAPSDNLELIVGTPEEQALMRKQIADGQAQLTFAMNETALEHEKLVVMREYLNRPIIDMDIVQAAYSSEVSPDEVWSQSDEDNYQKSMKTSRLISMYSDQVITGQRPVARRSDNAEIVILGKAGEKYVNVDGSNLVIGTVGPAPSQSGTVGLVWFEVIAIIAGVAYWALVSYGVYSIVHELIGSYNQTLQTLQLQEMKKFYSERRAAGDTPEQASAAVNVVTDGVAKIAKANIEAEKGSPMNKFLETAQSVMWAALGIGAVIALGYGIIQLAPLLKSHRSQTA